MILDSLRLLDLSYGLPTGTTCSHLLADMGMEVIKVESPAGGRATVGAGSRSDRALAFDSQNRNKKSIALDLKNPAANEAFRRLARTADALLECYRPGVAKRLGVDYDTIAAINPKIVYCSLCGYGQTGPYRSHGLHDYEGVATRGAFAQIGEDRVIIPADSGGVLLSDMSGGVHGALGIVAGLLARSRTGAGTYIDISMADSVSTFNIQPLQQALSGTPARGHDGPHILDASFLKCRDGKFIVQNNTEPANWAKFCEVIGKPEYAKWAEADADTRTRWIADIRAVMLTKTRDEWFALITATGASAAPAQTPEEVIEDPQVRARGLVWELDHPTEGRVRQWGSPILFKDQPAELRSYAPRTGQDTLAILESLGYTPKEMEAITGSAPVA